MITFPFVSINNLLIITSKKLYFSNIKASRKDYEVESFKSYNNFSELYDKENLDKDLLIVFNNNSSFEDEVEIESYFDDETIIQEALESEIKKKSTINSNVFFHYLKVESDSAKERQRYKLFGFDRDAYNVLLENINDKSSLSLITSAENLLFNYCQTFICKPYIALYRFNNQDILIVSDGDDLLFSRTHFDEENDLNSTIRSIEYVRQRFKDHDFEVYIGGDSIDNSFKSSLENSLGSPTQTFKKSSYPLFLEGLRKLPKIYNFIPRTISIQRSVNKLRDSLILLTLLVFFVSVMTFFINYSYYQSTLTVYQNMDKEYKSELKSLNLIGSERLNQLSKIKKLHSLDNLKFFKRLLKLIKPLSQEMALVEFGWKNQKRGDLVNILMKKKFKTLSEMDKFLLKLEGTIKIVEKNLPRIFIEKNLDFKNTKLSIRILSRKNHRKSSLHKKVNI